MTYCPEGECYCLEPCEMTAEEHQRLMNERPHHSERDCCIPTRRTS
jgi:hypothetical protein